MADADAGGQHEDLLANHALVLLVLLVHLWRDGDGEREEERGGRQRKSD